MKVLPIVLSPGDSLRDIFRVFEVAGAARIVFICPRHFSILSDVSFLKKLKVASVQFQKSISFVVKEAVLLDVLKSQTIEAFEEMPSDCKEEDVVTLRDFFPRVKAEKNTPIKSSTRVTKEVEHPKFSTHRIEQETDSSSLRGKMFFGAVFMVFLLSSIWIWISPRATVVIKPRVAPIPVTQNFLVALPEAEIPLDSQTLPQLSGIYVQTEVTETETMPATGRRYEVTNAKGKVTLYNETTKPKFLVPSRLVTKDGIIVRFNENVTIPPYNGERAGEAVVEVQADPFDEKDRPIGDRGNLLAGTRLIFPALQESSQELYYGVTNKGPLVGGSTLTHYFVEEADREKSKESLQESFHIRGVDRLQEEILSRSNREGKYYVLLDQRGLLKEELKSFVFPDHLMGVETQTFEVSGELSLFGVVFTQEPIAEFLAQKIEQSQDARKKLLQIDPLSVSYQVLESSFLEDQKWVKLSVSAIGVETLDVNPQYEWAEQWFEDLKKSIVDKTFDEARGLLANDPEIEDILEIRASPFWSKKMPKLWERIKFELAEL